MANISVILPVKNGATTIVETLDSLVAQTYKDFNVILINDGSTDNTIEIIDRYQDILNLKIIQNEVNLGISKSLNSGINIADSKYIARIDADDIAHPYRLEKQVEFMEKNPTTEICGSSMVVFQDFENDNESSVAANNNFQTNKERKVVKVLNHPTVDAEIKTSLLQFCSISHPSIICKRETFELYGKYNHEYDNAEDYELWTRMSVLGAKFSNIPENLTFYRQHAEQVGQSKIISQLRKDLKIKKTYISNILGREVNSELEFYFSLIKFNDKIIDKNNFKNMLQDLFDLSTIIWDKATFFRILERSYQRHIIE